MNDQATDVRDWIPSREDAVVPHSLEAWARRTPEALAVSFEDGSRWTYAHAVDEMYSAANALIARGVERGDFVAIFLRNGPEYLRAWWGAGLIGAIVVPLQPAYRGAILADVLSTVDISLVITMSEFVDRLAEVRPDLPLMMATELADGPTEQPPVEPVEFWHHHIVNFTSGTTGPTKAALSCWMMNYKQMDALDPYLEPTDVVLVDAPLSHMGGQSMVTVAWRHGACVALRTAFSGSQYVEIARETGATVSWLISSMATYLMAQPESSDDHVNSLRLVMAIPMVADPKAFMERFGIERMFSAYGMTETSCAVFHSDPISSPRAAGEPREGYELRLVDDNDLPVEMGQVGELVVRCTYPWALMVEYIGRPEATVTAWRNGWLHTGDMFRREGKYYFFVDRKKDTLRRRGENISSQEVEREALAHPSVSQAACVGVTTEYGDEDVKIFVIPADEDFQPDDLIRFMIPRLPYFMVPRYVEVIDEFPTTPTMRAQKHVLREIGNSSTTWDREAAGIVVDRFS